MRCKILVMNANKIHFKVEHFVYAVERKDLKVSIAAHDLKQKNIAEIFGISESYVSEVMNGAFTKKTPRWLIISILALQFIEDVYQVTLNSAYTETKLIGNILIAQAFGHQLHHFHFSLAEKLQRFFFFGLAGDLPE